MCGIAGAVGFVDDAIREAVVAMTGAQRHRGPDADGVWEDVSADSGLGVVLGHRRLSIIDLSHGANQPMRDARSGRTLVYNGEVYNYRELRAELEAEGEAFETRSDTEVVLRAWGHWGSETFRRLRGMFAFAAWSPQRRTLTLVRDRIGIKPLYWTRITRPGRPATTLFASELRALLATGLVPRRLDPRGLSTYFWNGFCVGSGSIAAGVSELAAGSVLELDERGGEIRDDRFWELPAQPDATGSKEKLAEALHDATRLRLVSDVPLGVFLSGGIDSSAVTALAVASQAGSVRTFNIAFEETEFDESSHARAVARALGTDHTEVRLAESDFNAQLDDALACLDQPSFDALNTYFVSRAVREAGLTVALAGTGGDELFGGYRNFIDLPRLLRVSRSLARSPAAARRVLATAVSRLCTGRPGAVAPQTRWGKLADALGAGGDLVALYQVSQALFTRSFLAELDAIPEQPGLPFGLPAARHDAFARAIEKSPLLHALSMLELWLFIGERLLRDTDSASMAVSLEVRVPLLDHVVIECASQLDEAVRFEPVGRKGLLRELALSRLDPGLFERPKSGFVLPIERWCRQKLRGEIEATFADAEACRGAGLDVDAVQALWRAFQADAPGIYWSRVWALFVLLRWCHQHRMSL
jgi:asparagine synthase (glutamine-hydrolysing)